MTHDLPQKPMSLSSLWQRLCRPNNAEMPQPIADQDRSGYDDHDNDDVSEADSDCMPLQDLPSRNAPGRSHPEPTSGRFEASGSQDSDSDGSGSNAPESAESESDSDQPGSEAESGSQVGEEEDEDDLDDEDESESETEVQARQRRQARTLKARKAAAESRLVKRVAKKLGHLPPTGKNSEYLPFLKWSDQGTKLTKPGQWLHENTKKRKRLIYSWFKSACSFINTFFEQNPCQHVFSVSVIDDTNTSLSTRVTASWQSSRTVTMLNNVQTCVACFEVADTDGHKHMEHRSFPMHTPPTCLPRANAPNLLQELRSWLMFEPGSRWHKFGLKSGLLAKVPFVCHIMCFDSLSTNIKVLKMLRRLFYRRSRPQQQCQQPVEPKPEDQAQLLTGLVCGIHQLALARKSLLFYHSGFWSNIVRLSHLFSTQTFRVQFRSALFAVIAESFSHITVSHLPAQHREWKSERDRLLNLAAGETEYRKMRVGFHKQLARFDNGDPSSAKITHWCVGVNCCQGLTQADRSNHCFIMLCKYFYFLFALGYAVPLTYRWKHAQPALRFCEDHPVLCAAPKLLGQWANGQQTIDGNIT